MQLLEYRHLRATFDAPRSPEVQDNDSPAQAAERNDLAPEGAATEIRGVCGGSVGTQLQRLQQLGRHRGANRGSLEDSKDRHPPADHPRRRQSEAAGRTL